MWGKQYFCTYTFLLLKNYPHLASKKNVLVICTVDWCVRKTCYGYGWKNQPYFVLIFIISWSDVIFTFFYLAHHISSIFFMKSAVLLNNWHQWYGNIFLCYLMTLVIHHTVYIPRSFIIQLAVKDTFILQNTALALGMLQMDIYILKSW